MKTIIHNAAQLIPCASDRPKRGDSMRDVGIIADGAIVIDGDRITAVGKTADILAAHSADHLIDAAGKVVCPGFVDPHTHVVYAGDRINEFEQRIQGASYMEIMAAGGGINSTVKATRAATLDELIAQSRPRLDTMLKLGTTTAEIKTGYGLDTDTELKMLRAIEELAKTHSIDLVPTFLGAHAVPLEYSGHTDAYTDYVIHVQLPAVYDWYRASAFADQPFYADVFCEGGVFSVEQSQRIWNAARGYGMGIKAHVDEFKSLGGVTAAIQAGAASIDHLDVTTDAEIAALAVSDTIGVILPVVNFNLGSAHYANARGMIDAGAAIALATDINPGSAPCPSMPLVMAIACRYQKLLPAEAMNAATINAAYAIGMEDLVGSLQVDKLADILILDAPDYRYLMYEFGSSLVQTVIKRGKIVHESNRP
jgi:imidazolonepropionase